MLVGWFRVRILCWHPVNSLFISKLHRNAYYKETRCSMKVSLFRTGTGRLTLQYYIVLCPLIETNFLHFPY
jgi:hypothetical protein